MRRQIGSTFLGLAAVLLISGCSPAHSVPAKRGADASQADPTSSARTIRISHQNDSVVLIARAKGWFEEEFRRDGTTVTYTRFAAGPPIIEAFSAGRQDVGSTGDMPPVSARAAGVNVKAIGVSGRSATGNTTVVLKDSPIKSVTDLKGKKLAAQVGSSQYHYALLLLKHAGLTGQVNLVNIQLTELRTALESKTVDAIVGNDRLAGTLEHEGVGLILPDSLGVKPGLAFWLVRGEFATQNPDLVGRFLKVVDRTTDYIQANPDEAAALYAKESGYPAPVVAKIFHTTDYGLSFRPDDIKNLEKVRDFLRETNVIKKDFDLNDLIDGRHLTDAGITK